MWKNFLKWSAFLLIFLYNLNDSRTICGHGRLIMESWLFNSLVWLILHATVKCIRIYGVPFIWIRLFEFLFVSMYLYQWRILFNSYLIFTLTFHEIFHEILVDGEIASRPCNRVMFANYGIREGWRTSYFVRKPFYVLKKVSSLVLET